MSRRIPDVLAHPEGWVWVPDRSWRSPAHLELCKRGCGTPPVAERDGYRHTGQRRGPRWYALCEADMAPYYRLRDGVVVRLMNRPQSIDDLRALLSYPDDAWWWTVGCRPVTGSRGAFDHVIAPPGVPPHLDQPVDDWRVRLLRTEPRRCPMPDCLEKIT